MTFEYLLAIPEPRLEEKISVRPAALARRRRSQSLLASLAQGQEKPLPELFNLDDLVLGSLRSRNQQTVTATLRLISTMLHTHHQYDVSLIKAGRPDLSMSLRPVKAHERNITVLFSMVNDLVDGSVLSESYDIHLEDAQNSLESHACTMQLLALPDGASRVACVSSSKSNFVNSSKVFSSDPVLFTIVSLLRDFFVNDIETNLSLTQVFSTMASCAKRSLEGWLLGSIPDSDANMENESPSSGALPNHNAKEMHEIPENDIIRSRDTSLPRASEFHHQSSDTPVFAALASLVQQVENFRQDVHDFDRYLAERRHLFNAGDDLEKSSNVDSRFKRRSEDSTASTRGPTKPTPQIASISERLMSENSTAVGSRSSSPRGRQLDAPSAPSLVGRLTHLRLSPSRSPSTSAARAISPSPLRKHTTSNTSPERIETSSGPPPDVLRQKFKIRINRHGEISVVDVRSETSSIRSESTSNETPATEQYREVTLNHILTNVIILQEFILEMAAIIQVRASLFGEVKFD